MNNYTTEELVKALLRPTIYNYEIAAIIARLRAGDKLCEILEKTASWYEQRIAQCERQEKQNRGRFNSLADACAFDAKNYRIQLEEARKAIAEYEGKP